MEITGNVNIHDDSKLLGPAVGHNAGNININHNHGLSHKDVTNLFEILLENNFPKLLAQAEQSVRARLEELQRAFLEQANKSLRPEDTKVFAEPDMQFILIKSIETTARKDSKELRNNLASLLVERIKHNDDDFLRIVTGEAIIAIGKLTTTQLKLMASWFIISYYTRYKEINTWDQLSDYLNTYAKPFIGFKSTFADIQHIGYTGCAMVNYSPLLAGLSHTFTLRFPHLFRLPIERSALDAINIPKELEQHIFENVTETTVISKIHSADLDRIIRDVPLAHNEENQIRQLVRDSELYDSRFRSRDEKPATLKIVEAVDGGEEFVNMWNSRGLSLLHLSSVGIVIAAVYCTQILGEEIDLTLIFESREENPSSPEEDQVSITPITDT